MQFNENIQHLVGGLNSAPLDVDSVGTYSDQFMQSQQVHTLL